MYIKRHLVCPVCFMLCLNWPSITILPASIPAWSTYSFVNEKSSPRMKQNDYWIKVENFVIFENSSPALLVWLFVQWRGISLVCWLVHLAWHWKLEISIYTIFMLIFLYSIKSNFIIAYFKTVFQRICPQSIDTKIQRWTKPGSRNKFWSGGFALCTVHYTEYTILTWL